MFRNFLMTTSYREDQCRVIFLAAVWPERLYGVDFFKKSSEIRDSNLSEIDENWSDSDKVSSISDKFESLISKLFSKKSIPHSLSGQTAARKIILY